jgi:hypothetical protein
MLNQPISVAGEVKPRPKVKNLGESGILPAVLKNHPGRSRLMELSDEIWSAWTEDQQAEYLEWLDARCQDFTILHDQRTGWIKKNAGDDIDKAVFPIPGELLP